MSIHSADSKIRDLLQTLPEGSTVTWNGRQYGTPIVVPRDTRGIGRGQVQRLMALAEKAVHLEIPDDTGLDKFDSIHRHTLDESADGDEGYVDYFQDKEVWGTTRKGKIRNQEEKVAIGIGE